MFRRKSSCHRDVSATFSTQRVHSEPTTRRKFGSAFTLNRSKSTSIKSKRAYGSMSNAASNRSLGSQDLDSNPHSEDESVSQSECGSVSSPDTSRRLAICVELEKYTFMEDGESLLNGHKNLVIRDVLESYAYI